jgi:hypothetical protein
VPIVPLSLLALLAVVPLPGPTPAPAADDPPPHHDEPPPHQAPPKVAEPPRPWAPHEHRGMHLRALIGPGYTSASTTLVGQDVKVASPGLGLYGAVGGAVADNVVLSLEGIWSIPFSSTVTANSVEGMGPSINNMLLGVGVSITYYVMPMDLFLSAGIDAAFMKVWNDYGAGGSTNLGPFGSFALGKEWWVSDSVGMGVAAHFLVGSTSDAAASWSTWGMTIGLSVTGASLEVGR